MFDKQIEKSGFVELPDAQLAYEVVGEGDPLVLLHSGVADRRMWDDQVRAFSQYYRVIRYDLRGYGESTLLPGPYSHYEDLAAVLDFFEIEQAYLLGCSQGGMTIIDFALTYPSRVSALIPVSCMPGGYWTPANPDLKQPDPSILKMLMHTQELLQQGNLRAAAENEADYYLTGPHRSLAAISITPAQHALLYEMNTIALKNRQATQHLERQLDPPAITRLHDISVPSLLLYGDQDDANVIHGCHILARNIPGIQTNVIPNVAHYPNIEQPATFNQLVLDFLSQR